MEKCYFPTSRIREMLHRFLLHCNKRMQRFPLIAILLIKLLEHQAATASEDNYGIGNVQKNVGFGMLIGISQR